MHIPSIPMSLFFFNRYNDKGISRNRLLFITTSNGIVVMNVDTYRRRSR